MASNPPDNIPRTGPQAGPQTQFAECTADICIFGGAAYGGKTFAMLIEPLRAISSGRFNGVIFRREMPQITAGGGLWDTSEQLYPACGGKPKISKHIWRWGHGASIKMTHLQRESDKYSHHSAQYVFIGFDELEFFTETQFWYLWTRNRPPSGYKGRCWCRAATNPNADSWIRELIDWWIGPNGYPVPERSGILRWFTRDDDKIVWVKKSWCGPDGIKPKSLTFIPSYIDDNPIGNSVDPSYRANLYAQDMVTRERLLRGNWNISYKGGMFNPNWLKIIDLKDVPGGLRKLRYWDFAATPKDEEHNNNPDWSVGTQIGYDKTDIYVLDVQRMQASPATVEKAMKKSAEVDGKSTVISWEEEKGSSGKYVSSHMKELLKDYEVMPDPVVGQKIERAKPVSAYAEQGHVYYVRADWNRSWLAEFGNFPLGKKDQVDSLSGAVKVAKLSRRVWPRFSRTDERCCRLFTTPWDGVHHYAAVVISKSMVLHVLTAVWKGSERRLYVYGELVGPELSASKIASNIVMGMGFATHTVHGIFGSPDMFAQGRSAANVLSSEISRVAKAKNVSCRALVSEPPMYDRVGAIGLASLMFHNGEIVIHKGCATMGTQAATWNIDNDRPAKGFEMCECLCIIVSEINRVFNLRAKEAPPGDPHYRRVVEKPSKRKVLNTFMAT